MTRDDLDSKRSKRLAGRVGWLPAILLALVALGLSLAPIAFLTPRRAHSALAAEPIDTATLRLIDDRTRITLAAFRLNRVTNTYLGTATVTNTGADTLAAPLYLVVGIRQPRRRLSRRRRWPDHRRQALLRPHRRSCRAAPWHLPGSPRRSLSR